MSVDRRDLQFAAAVLLRLGYGNKRISGLLSVPLSTLKSWRHRGHLAEIPSEHLAELSANRVQSHYELRRRINQLEGEVARLRGQLAPRKPPASLGSAVRRLQRFSMSL